MGFAAVAVEASWYAVAQLGRTTLDLGLYVVNSRGVSTAVSAAVAPGFEY